jgi:hypothetical protein
MFNMGGYFILYSLLERSADAALTERIQNGEVALSERVTIRVPFELPYPVYDQHIDVIDGRVKANSETYSFTGHSYADNTLTLVGVRDQWGMHVEAVMSAFNKAASGDVDPVGLIHGISSMLQSFIANSSLSIIQQDPWVQLINKREPAKSFPAIDLPVIPEPPRT